MMIYIYSVDIIDRNNSSYLKVLTWIRGVFGDDSDYEHEFIKWRSTRKDVVLGTKTHAPFDGNAVAYRQTDVT